MTDQDNSSGEFIARTIRLELESREVEILWGLKVLSANGTWSAAVRKQMGWPERPHRIIATERRETSDSKKVP